MMICEKINPFLTAWSECLTRGSEWPALLSGQGGVLRTRGQLQQNAELLTRQIPAGGGVVSLPLGNGPEFCETVLAAWMANCGVLLLPSDTGEEERSRLEALAGATCRAAWAGDQLVLTPTHLPPVEQTASCAVLKVTSGSTAQPRLVRMTSGQLWADCRNIIHGMGLRPDDVQYGVIPWSHSYGFSSLVSPLFATGIRLVCAGDTLPRAICEGLINSGATVFPGVPALFRPLAGVWPGAVDRLRLCISAGAPLTSKLARDFSAASGLKLHSFYGSSECGGISYDVHGEGGMEQDGFVGSPLPGVTLNLLPDENAGGRALEVSGDAVAAGYWPEDNSGALANGVFRPSDLLELCGEGYRIVGRVSDFINIGGRKVNPVSVELALLRCPGVTAALVVGRLSNDGHKEEICALVVGPEIEKAATLQALGQHLPAWCLPRELRVVEKLPVNPRGKFNRMEVSRMYFPQAPDRVET